MKIVLLSVILLRGGDAKAQCLHGDCQNGFGTAIFKKGGGVRYTGYFKNKKPNGNGVAEYPNGRRYDGEWFDGMFHGNGTMTLTDGTTLSGNWEFSRFKGAVKYAQQVYKVEQQTTPNTTEMRYLSQPVLPKPIKQTTTASADVTMPRTWALAVGVAEYENPTIPRLKYPDNDAFSMYAFWKSPLGGALDDAHSRVLVDDAATQMSIKNAMRDMFTKAATDDLVIFFFSGHGLKGSFLPTDYDGENIRLYHAEINKLLADCPAKYKLVIADACHSGSYVATKGWGKTVRADIYEKTEPGTAFMLSSLAEEESLEVSTLHNSVFTHFVLRGLKGEADLNNNRIVTIKELFNYVYENVTTYAASLQKVQTPVLKGTFDPEMPVAILR